MTEVWIEISPSFFTFMQIFPPEDWLVASSLPSKFVPSAIQKILDELTPENIRYKFSFLVLNYYLRLNDFVRAHICGNTCFLYMHEIKHSIVSTSGCPL